MCVLSKLCIAFVECVQFNTDTLYKFNKVSDITKKPATVAGV